MMTTDKRGVSALLLQRQLGLRRYETAWMMLHKLRRAMVNAARERTTLIFFAALGCLVTILAVHNLKDAGEQV